MYTTAKEAPSQIFSFCDGAFVRHSFSNPYPNLTLKPMKCLRVESEEQQNEGELTLCGK